MSLKFYVILWVDTEKKKFLSKFSQIVMLYNTHHRVSQRTLSTELGLGTLSVLLACLYVQCRCCPWRTWPCYCR